MTCAKFLLLLKELNVSPGQIFYPTTIIKRIMRKGYTVDKRKEMPDDGKPRTKKRS